MTTRTNTAAIEIAITARPAPTFSSLWGVTSRLSALDPGTAKIDSYTPATGLLQLHSGSTMATLFFDNATLGPGSFRLAADSGTGTMLTRS